jgi:hypothetical protein
MSSSAPGGHTVRARSCSSPPNCCTVWPLCCLRPTSTAPATSGCSRPTPIAAPRSAPVRPWPSGTGTAARTTRRLPRSSNLGMYTRRTGPGWYCFVFSSSASRASNGPGPCHAAGVSRSSAITAPSSLMTPSDSSRRPNGLGCRLVPPVAVATRSPRGLPCSALSLVHVLSLIPRGSPPLRLSSGFTVGAAFARSGGARPPRLCYGATLGFTRVTARALALPGLRRGPRGPSPPGQLHVWTTSHNSRPQPTRATGAAVVAKPARAELNQAEAAGADTDRLAQLELQNVAAGVGGQAMDVLKGVPAGSHAQWIVRRVSGIRASAMTWSSPSGLRVTLTSPMARRSAPKNRFLRSTSISNIGMNCGSPPAMRWRA